MAQIQLELVVCFELVTVQQFGERGLTRLVFRYPEDLPDPEAARDELANALFKAAEQIASGGALEGSLRDTRFEIGRLKIVDRRERRPSPTPA